MRGKRIATTALVGMLVTCTVWATNRAVRAEHLRLFQEGNRLAEHQYTAALVQFERALAYRVTTNTLFNTALCHLYLGHRDMALWFVERYLVLKPAARASLEVQRAVAAIAEEDEDIAPDQRYPLDDRLSDAINAAVDGDATPAESSQQIYGTGGSSAEATARWRLANDYGTTLFRSGLDQLTDTNWEASQAFFERSLAYRSLRNAAYNVASIHLLFGRRDLAVHFYRMYINNTPQIHGDTGVEAALQAIKDSPPRVGNQARRSELNDQMDMAVQRALVDTPGTAEPTAVESPTRRD